MRLTPSLLLMPAALVQAAQAPPAIQHQGPPAVLLGASERKAVLETLGKELKAKYVFPEIAERVAVALGAKAKSGGYDGATTAASFAEALSKDLRELGKDGHFRVRFDPRFKAETDEDKPPTKEELAQGRREMASMGFGIERLERLPGNVGYVELRGFGPMEFVGAAYTKALSLLAGSEALILDLRRNGGGSPESVAFLMSHFFPEGDSRHLNDLYNRPKNETRQFWTDPSVTQRYAAPVYVLTSARTFSGGEECAYDFQTQKRGILVGETTGGGANPGGPVALGSGLVCFVPTGRAINPITKTNWEHVGVKPDLPVPAADALKTAYAAILKDLVQKEKDPEEREQLEGLLGRVEKGESEKPNYTPRR